MRNQSYDAIVIGGGAAGMSAAAEIARRGYSTAIIERDPVLGGILLQCIHNGFGLHEFKEELTGPEYAERWEHLVAQENIDVFCDTTVIDMSESGDASDAKTAVCVSPREGMFQLSARAVVLATGCRERNRGGIRIPGTRPAGVYTAGLAQRMVNLEGYLPGKDIVIVGSGDIGLIMARRMTWSGCKVHAVVEIQPYPSGLTRNISQCLNDFDIPLYLSHVVSGIHGKRRVESVDITPLEGGRPDHDATFSIECDTLLLSVGLIPSHELARTLGAELNPLTNGPMVDSRMMTTVPGLFSCGNVLHVHDLVDFVSAESRRAGAHVAEYLQGYQPSRQVRIKPGANIRYVAPAAHNPERPEIIYFRPMIVKNDAVVQVLMDSAVIKEYKKSHVQPSEMIEINMKKLKLDPARIRKDSVLEVRLQ
ncbi:NAD(P)/FAD-dependent oxidoreductase [Spirochaeta africana]|uniref:Thioredoxin reductase n=1 Tax=Spirochaeta africana (strain ATCC 700263 / DSM 8902 / Z-7692) TaxID=889378 RepID=H9UFY7_SPIAZ|nr:FAD-dependent oxidoreductase [Spirochaeta africana]AFG36430.1 thioredoxin reductase [Spirochaeta africana DSM 8902]